MNLQTRAQQHVKYFSIVLFLLARLRSYSAVTSGKSHRLFVSPLTVFQKLTRLKSVTASRKKIGWGVLLAEANLTVKGVRLCILMWWRAHYVGQVFNSFPLDMLFTSKCVSFWIPVESNTARPRRPVGTHYTSSRIEKILLNQNAKATSLLQNGFEKKMLAFITAPCMHWTRFATCAVGYYLCAQLSPIRRVNR